MKIAISAQNESKEAALDPRFGRCACFAVYDSEQDNWRFMANEGVKAGGGAGLAAAQQIIDSGITAVITGNMGPNAFDVLNGEEIHFYQCTQGSVTDAVKNFNEKKLNEITAAGPAHAGTRGGVV